MLQQAVAALRRPRLGPLLLLMLHVTAMALFVHGFLLTRVHLSQRSSSPPTAAASPPTPPYDRVVWLLIDALRYDFVVADGRYRCLPGAGVCHQGHMPYLSSLAAHTVSSWPQPCLPASGHPYSCRPACYEQSGTPMHDHAMLGAGPPSCCG